MDIFPEKDSAGVRVHDDAALCLYGYIVRPGLGRQGVGRSQAQYQRALTAALLIPFSTAEIED